ncbi:MATE family efflux transporter [Pseudothermotoga thermarum]|uniref:MATE family efflux transporter n=1 Tax=Pseudothermotoga thermarum TaxID=119394 RepID=UPI001B7FDC7E|nr:MATE family efflux transporter [Pseudothermotoga thermarum]
MSIVEKYRDEIVDNDRPIIKTLLKLGVPLMLVQLVHISYHIVDAYWLGQYSSELIAAPRQVWPTFMLFHALSMALSTANLALLSQYVGARMYDKVRETLSKFFTVSLILGVLFSVLYFALREVVFGIMLV